ncbi:4-(cytidine 5'-diphospho)-2-C-methyl-D-erythritol kinase [uncultured Sphingomonas sp.]|uniref:4-(cytidine 5'-diphospho)-2-C-methyl-D-erythritol kinase n=1 Tax=uncultured Sphingomonas sp. TaxID=158754 RepID=UPI0035CAE1BC
MITEPAPAKLNLALHVRARRPDGYHEIETLFAFCRDGDSVTLASAVADSFAVTGPFASSLGGERDNLVVRARDAFAGAFGPLPPLAVTLDKRLPVASGIGGGSADAAAMLRALATIRGVDRRDPVLARIALDLGSDVPACLAGTAAIGGGRGERLAPVAGLGNWPVLLVNPGVKVATGPVFAGWDRVDRGGLGQGGPVALALDGRNDLEQPATAIAPVIAEILALLRGRPGVVLARMSGSGATCFALFDDDAARAAAYAAIAGARRDWWCLETMLA